MAEQFERFAISGKQPVAQNEIDGNAENQDHDAGKGASQHGQERQLRKRVNVRQLAAEEVEIKFFV